jgi:hypothetical protein
MYTEYVDHDSTILGRQWFVVVTSGGNIRKQGLFANGAYGYITYSNIIYDSALIYKFPVTVNEVYINPKLYDTVQVIDDHSSVITPAGSFDCIVYQRRLLSGDSTHFQILYDNTYVARGYGKIKGEMFYYDSLSVKRGMGTWQLIKYSFH